MGQKILIIDDSADILFAQKMILENAGFEVICAPTGNEGCRIITREPPALVITDLMMSDGDGIQVAMFVKETCPSIPTVMVTGGGNRLSSADAISFSEAFFDAYLQKPFSADQLLDTVRQFVPN